MTPAQRFSIMVDQMLGVTLRGRAGRPFTQDEEVRRQIAELIDANVPKVEIARKLNVPIHTVKNLAKRRRIMPTSL